MGQSAILGEHPMGHKLTGSEHVLRFGWNVEATVIVANDTGFDSKATVKKNAWRTPLDICQFCPFKKF